MTKLGPLVYSVCNKLRRDLHLACLRRSGRDDAQAVFQYYFEKNLFGDRESLSGTGSSLAATGTIRAALPPLFDRLGVRSVLDVPCGDFNWLRALDWSGIAYIGADVVPDLIERNRARHGAEGIRFQVIDVLGDDLPRADLVLCRDLFIHLPNDSVRQAVANVRRSGATWLLATHYAGVRRNRDIPLGSFRPVNLECPPFGLPPPRATIRDADYLDLWGRTLSLWAVADLP